MLHARSYLPGCAPAWTAERIVIDGAPHAAAGFHEWLKHGQVEREARTENCLVDVNILVTRRDGTPQHESEQATLQVGPAGAPKQSAVALADIGGGELGKDGCWRCGFRADQGNPGRVPGR